jgi:hypothetical protein
MVLDSPIISGSATFLGNLVVTGSITTSGSITISGSIASASYSTNTTTASYAVNATTASYANIATSASYAADASNSTLFNSTASTVFATTGSNNFTGTAYHSNTNDATAFSGTTASIYTDGGLQVTKNAYFSSSLYVKGNFTIYGTQSVNYITSSQLNIATNLITVNTSTPSIRFGGIAVQDSGSVNGLTGSLLWDSQTNNWIYSNPSGSGNYDSAMVLMGPTNNGGLGNEVGIGVNYLAKGAGGHHMTSSGIYESGSNVGIGTSSPSYLLHLYKSSEPELCLQNSAAVWRTGINSSSEYFIYTSNSYAMYFATSGSERMRITSGGNVGIGTSSPQSIVHAVKSNSTAPTSGTTPNGYGLSFGAGEGNNGGIWFSTDFGGDQGISGIAGTRVSGYTTDLRFYTNDTNSARAFTERMRITSGGNVGIGTITPSTILELSTSSPKITLTPTAYSGNYRTILGTRSGAEGVLQLGNNNPNYIVAGNTGTGGSLHFYVNAASDFITSTNGTLAMVLASSGNVGIGTSSPVSIGGYTALTLNNATTGGILTFQQNGTNKGSIYNDSSNIYIGVNSGAAIFETSGAERMRITSDGSVLINYTSNLGPKFTVSSNVNGLPTTSGTSQTNAALRLRGGDNAVLDMGLNSVNTWIQATDLSSLGTYYNILLNPRGGYVGINDAAPSTRLSINGANYVEMATFTCTNAAAATIITDNGGYVQFSLGTARHCSNSSLFVPVTDGIKITKSGIVHISFSQDITTTGTTGYVAGYIQKNKNNISENLITNTNGQWDGINGVGTINVAADDVINFSFNAGDITSFDPGSWSQYSFVWTSR